MKTRFLALSLFCLPLWALADGFVLNSPDLAEGKTLSMRQVFNGFGCHGDNRSPALAWHGAPAGTRSFAVTVYDPDAPTGSGWWHWTVFDLPAATHALPTGAGDRGGALPAGAKQGRTDFGFAGYGGACPPPGDKPHHYRFTVWALNVDTLGLDAQASGAMVGFALRAHALGSASITTRYGR
jgi:Raf kinase inhibitor-like YbhB/YbcL family protein